MSHREEAIKRILDEGADLTEENITAEVNGLEKAAPKPDPNRDMLDQLKGIRDIMTQLVEVVTSQNHEIKIPEIKLPTINVPPANVTIPERSQRKTVYSFVRDDNGNIIQATADEE